MALQIINDSWREEAIGDNPIVVSSEWDAEIDRRLREVEEGRVALVPHDESMRVARERLAARHMKVAA